MKFLNTFLVIVFAILVILLLLLKDCTRVTPPEPEVITPDPVIVPVPVDRPTPEPEAPEEDEIDRANDAGQTGALKITLLWDMSCDLDLHVTVPSGNEISYLNRNDAGSTGELDMDNIPGGSGSAENVFFTNPPTGTYKVEVVLYSNQNEEYPSIDAVVIVQARDRQPERYPIHLTRVGERKFVTDIVLD